MPDLPPAAQLFQMITGFAVTQAIHAAAKLDIADRLAGGPRAVDELARESGADPDALYRLLRALAGAGIFAETEPRTFGLTPMAELLRPNVPGSQHAVALMMGGEQFRAWGELLHSIKTGRPAFDHVHGAPLFDHLARHPEQGRIFDRAMTGIHGPETPAMIEAYDFSAFGTIIDVGGGNGSTLIEILRAAPGTRGVVFDLPGVIERTAPVIAEAGMQDRCRAEAGDFFEAVPGGGDAYILRHIVHDWDDERSARILRHCRDAAAAGSGKVLVVESVIPPGNDPHPGKWLDLIMLAIPGGRERTAEEFDRLFKEAGLRIERIVPTRSPVSIVEGVVA